MKKELFLTFLCVTLTITSVLCSIQLSGGNSDKTVDAATLPTKVVPATEEPADKSVITTYAKDDITLSKGDIKILELTDTEQDTLTGFSSSDTNVATIDSGGRIDAISEGTATITIDFTNLTKAECNVVVTQTAGNDIDRLSTAANAKAGNDIDRFSTAINANTDILEYNKASNFINPYEIRVNRRANCVTVYTYDENGEYTIPIRAMVCSTGKNNSTITGEFNIYFRREWHPLYQGVYGHYVSGISGDYLFHSVPYYTAKSDDIEIDEFNKLGTQASLGCVRLAVADTKWIYENCGHGTKVTIYDDDNPGPLGKPETIKITDKSCGWDPTDSSKSNPYYNKAPIISGAKDCTIKQGDTFSPLDGVSAVDTCSNDITKKIEVKGNVVTSRKGKYLVTYSVTDVLNRTTTVNITVSVV